MMNEKNRWINSGKISAESLSLLLVLAVYTLIMILSIDKCYFWDNVQFTSKEAHWYYNNNFSSFLLPGFSENSEIVGTGCHPPLIGFITAVLWKILGKHLWISHVFIALWAWVLVWNTWKLLKVTVREELKCFVSPVLLLDSTVLSQLYIASPDIILLASFVTALRAVIEKRRWLLTAALFFLVLISGRGAATGGIFLLFYIIHQNLSEHKAITPRSILNTIVPFLPGFMLAGLYYIIYISNYGWFFTNPDSPWAESGARPDGLLQILKNIAAFCLRLGENGRFFLYLMGIILLVRLNKESKIRKAFSGFNLALGLMFLILLVFFLYFVVTTTAVMTSRYYMEMFFIFIVLLYRMLPDAFSVKTIRLASVIAVILLITGNLWMYPDKISKAWDATLAHVPYYEVRNKCLDYLVEKNYDLTKVSGGFCFTGNQRYVDLKNRDVVISGKKDNNYYIYSNISNLDDDLIDELTSSGKWHEIKTFKKGFVHVSVFENSNFASSE